jgi:pyruvate/2-oxoglutarate dehydrogenase complex dihydrolipoamide acyltransferase (E2) component
LILSLSLQRMGEQMRIGTVHRVLAHAGDALRPGTPLLEVRVDLGAAKAQDCPPVFHFRVIATERAHLRSVLIAPGDRVEVGAPLGVATTSPDEPFDAPGARALRTTSVAIQVDPLSA